MAPPENRLDDRFKSGLFYDVYNGDFCRFVDRCEKPPALETPEGDEYFTYSSWSEFFDDQANFREVDETVVENPADYFEEWASRMYGNEAQIDVELIYADRNTVFISSDEYRRLRREAGEVE